MTYKDANIIYISQNAGSILEQVLWPEGPVCPDCGCHEYTRMKDGRYRCKHCGRKYTIKVGTIFEHSHIGLDKWMIALYLMLQNKGVSSCALARYIGVSQTCAYNMLMKLRFLLSQEDVVLEGEIAIDEEYVGGQWGKMCLKKRLDLLSRYKLPKNPQGQREKMSISNKVNSLYKTPVIGMNDGQHLVLKVVPKPVSQADIVEIFNKHSVGSGYAVSDCSPLYDDWESLTGYQISHNNHSKGQFVSADGRSSNRIEGSFSQWKRQALDKHCSISPRLLQLYLDEHCFRFNHRDLPIMDRIYLALGNAHQKVNRDVLKKYNSLGNRKNYPIEVFDPVEFFKSTDHMVSKVNIGGIVYRKEDWIR